ncbi:protein GRAVITROPIC IN THE LIGHT 1 [Gastrolobium bilobum]|uniref:protein GRAVITROPIC IN THE LIGHT 1 n=1 Tax=Gastrolobium bilobum TaxID=150636 RepID=UPI002AAF2E69|nr:protein GRAVITROPIC IN THE LIGHT 1 [Gastrolobium bilobum]
MTRKVSNFSDLIQRVTASCLLHPLAAGVKEENSPCESEENRYEEEGEEDEDEEEGEGEEDKGYEEENGEYEEEKMVGLKGLKVKQMEAVMEDVFETVSSMKRAYVRLQEAHSPWDPEKMRAADVAMVAELRKLAVLRERFRRNGDGGGGRRRVRRRGGGGIGAVSLREVVAPYEAVVEELKKEVKTKDLEVQNLKEKLENVVALSSNGSGEKKPGRSQSKRKLGIQAIAAVPTPELFEATMVQVKEASKSFTSLLLSLMHNAHWDITAAVRSIEAATASTDKYHITSTTSIVSSHHAKYALESYISRKIFQGFDHETFYMDGSLSSLLNPDQFRRDCFTQYRDMKSMDPTELLGILPTCHFGKFCSKKYLAIVHPKMEESLFGNLEQHSQVQAGNHPRSEFYTEFLGMAKTVWLLHLLAFSLNPAPSQFEASRGAEFHPQYMDSVVKFSGGRVPAGQVVGFPVSPGFKLGNGSVIKARVYLIART